MLRDAFLLVVHLRGGADGLGIVVPAGDAAYRRLRPGIAVPADQLVAFDGLFGLHPAMSPLLPLWERGEAAAVHAVGWPGGQRSHFEAWEEIESGAAGEVRPASGWLTRALRATERRGEGPEPGANPGSSLEVACIGNLRPALLQGCGSAVAMRDLSGFRLRGARGGFTRGLERLYATSRGPGATEARHLLGSLERLEPLRGRAHDPAFPRTAFGRGLETVAHLAGAGLGLRAATIDLIGFDTHVAQGGRQGPLASLLAELAGGLAAFASGLRAAGLWSRTRVVAITEFGRRVAENGGGGTDHGEGSVALLLGGSLRGGRVVSEWPGLSTLSGPGDLRVTGDLRDVLAEAAGLPSDRVNEVFPAFTRGRPLGLFSEAA